MKFLSHGFVTMSAVFVVARVFGQTPPAAGGFSTRGSVVSGAVTAPSAGAVFSGQMPPALAIAAPGFEGGRQEMETVTFLGVETTRVGPAFAAQLNLQEGTGLLVTSVEPDSPAAAVFKPHDILLRLDDQILVVQEQLSVLIRGHKEGDQVALTYLRAGRSATVKVKLGKHEVPKMDLFFEGPMGGGVFGFSGPGGAIGFSTAMPVPPGNLPAARREADRLLSIMPRGPGGKPRLQMRIDDQGAPGLRAMTVDPANSKLVYSDEAGSLEMTIKEGQKSLVARDAKGAEVFSGPVTTPEERKAMPPPVRERLEKFEGMRESAFQTDGQFEGAETKVVVPRGRSI